MNSNMNRLKIISHLLVVLITFNCPAFGQFQLTELSNPDSMGISSDSLEKMNDYFHNLVDEKSLAGIQTAIIRGGQLIHFETYGYNNIEKKNRSTKRAYLGFSR